MHIRVQHEFTTMYNEKYVSIEHERTNGTRVHEYMRMRVILSSTHLILCSWVEHFDAVRSSCTKPMYIVRQRRRRRSMKIRNTSLSAVRTKPGGSNGRSGCLKRNQLAYMSTQHVDAHAMCYSTKTVTDALK